MQLDPTGRIADRLPRPRDGARRRRHLRGHRGADQPAADREGDPGGRLLQAGSRATSTASACGRRATSTSARSRRSSAAAATRTPPAAPSPARSTRCSRTLVEKIEGAIDGRPARRRQAGRPDLARRRRARAPRAAARRRIGHTGTLDPLATGVLPLVARPRDAARAVPERERQVVRRRRPPRRSRPTPPTRRGGRSAPVRERPAAVARRDRRGARRRSAARSCSSRRRSRRRRSTASGATSSRERARERRLEPVRRPRARPVMPDLPACPVERHGARASRSSAVEADRVTLRVDCSAGFYVRSLAHDLGERLGIGAHLAALRRTRTRRLRRSTGRVAARRRRARSRAGGRRRIVPLSRACCRTCPPSS